MLCGVRDTNVAGEWLCSYGCSWGGVDLCVPEWRIDVSVCCSNLKHGVIWAVRVGLDLHFHSSSPSRLVYDLV